MKPANSRIVDSAWTFAALGCVLLVVISIGPAVIGRRPYVVMGGSMEPVIPVGSVVVTERVAGEEVRQGDVITYVNRVNQIVTHRVMKIVADASGLSFETKGDANAAPDPEPVRPINVVGRVWYAVPLTGYVLHFATMPTIKLATVAIASVIVALCLLGSLEWPSARRRRAVPVSVSAADDAG
jgi:signal peptidase I